MKRIWKIAGILAGAGILSIGILLYIVPLFFSLPEGIESPPEKGLLFTDRNGEPLRRFLARDDLRVDQFVHFSELPQNLIDATLAAEDERFFSHGGIDFVGVARATRDALRNKRFVSGASTITQQLVKLASPEQPRTLKTKLFEMARARKLEFFQNKKQILACYLNRLPYGNQLTGCRAAARRYFGKPVSDLSLAESAFLAGIPNKPTKFNPYRNFEEAKKRQLWVLGRMKKEELITANQFQNASREPLLLQPENSNIFHAPHFIELFAKFHPEEMAEGKTIRTSLDLPLQNFVETSVVKNLGTLAREKFIHQNSDLQAAVVVIENATGEIRALTGSRSFFGSDSGQINGAWTPRSAGSTLKPFTYLLALERNFTAASILPDVPVEYVSSAGAYQPVNFDRRFNGPVTLRSALATSLNVPAVRVLNEIGGPRVLHEFLTKDLKLTSLGKDGTPFGLGLTLGNAEVRLLELTNAYASLARPGKWMPFRFTPSLYPLQSPTVPSSMANCTLFNPENGWILADILSDNQARAPAFGMNSALRFSFPVACKTGTSTDFRDNWAIGYTAKFTVGVWLGRFNNRPLPNRLSGALGAGPIFHEIMVHLHPDKTTKWFAKPDGIVEKKIDLLNGLEVNPALPFTPQRTGKEFFRKTRVPRLGEKEDYSSDGKTLLPLIYNTWWREKGASLESFAAISVSDRLNEDPDALLFRIVSPLPGTVAFLDPDLPSRGQRFPLRIAGTGSEEIEWACESLDIVSRADRNWVVLEPGHHEISATDRATGRVVKTTIAVEEF